MSYSSFPLAEGISDASPALPSQEEATRLATVPPTVPAAVPSCDASVEETAAPIAAQIASLCWRFRKGRVQVLLVTSRETRRWVLPKGWPMPGLTPEAAAAREAWEEAGVEGTVCTTSIGKYIYDKILPTKDPLACSVAVYPLRVRFLKQRFPEQKQRRRKWFSAEDASHQVAEPELTALLEMVALAPGSLAAKSVPPKSVKQKSVKQRSVKQRSVKERSVKPKSVQQKPDVPKSEAVSAGLKAGSTPIKTGKP